MFLIRVYVPALLVARNTRYPVAPATLSHDAVIFPLEADKDNPEGVFNIHFALTMVLNHYKKKHLSMRKQPELCNNM